MTEYKRLDNVIGARHFRDTYVCTSTEKVISERRPQHSEFLSGRIVPLEGDRSMLILIFDHLTKHQRHPVTVPIKFDKHDGESNYYSIAQTDDRVTVIS